jgi:uncharacterized protein (TIGR02301 family)
MRLAFAAKSLYSRTMKVPAPSSKALGLAVAAIAVLAWAPVAEAQFFWSPWFQEQPRARPKPRPAKPAAKPGDDLPPIVPKEESSLPPPPDDRPYDVKLLRLTEILGAVHYLRELCGAQEGQLWRDQMKEILKNEGSTAARRAKLVNAFNDGYRGYRRTYRSCTSSATLAVTRFSTEGAQIAAALAQPSHYASRNAAGQAGAQPAAAEASPPADKDKASTGAAASATPEGDANRTGKAKRKKAEPTKPAAPQAPPKRSAEPPD